MRNRSPWAATISTSSRCISWPRCSTTGRHCAAAARESGRPGGEAALGPCGRTGPHRQSRRCGRRGAARQRSQQAVNVTDKLAQQRGDQFISSELFVLAACDDRGELGRLLKANGAARAALEKAIDEVRGGAKVEDAGAEENRQALEKYSIDLTERATQGKLDPVIGRDDEIRRTIQVLQRRTKNNPCSSASRAWARRHRRRIGARSASSTAKCRRACATSAFCRWTWAR